MPNISEYYSPPGSPRRPGRHSPEYYSPCPVLSVTGASARTLCLDNHGNIWVTDRGFPNRISEAGPTRG